MQARTSWLVTALIVVLGLSVVHAHAEITALTGAVRATVQEFRSNEAGRTDDQALDYPTTSATLPLQVEAQLLVETGDPAAAAAAAQFADPLLTQPNPEEFAINLALVSVSDSIRYTGQGTSSETRDIVFTRQDYPLNRSGDTLQLTGHLFVDGALSVFSPTAGRDLSGANVYLRVTVVKRVTGQADETVFTGRVGLEGAANGVVHQVAADDFPTRLLILTDLSVFVPEFAVFQVLIIPSVTISYPYTAKVDEPFTLVATVDVEAANIEDQTGVSAVIGTPVDAIEQVIAAAQGQVLATKAVNALQKERANPTGTVAFPESTAKTTLPMCGLFGFEFLLGLAGLAGLRSSGICRRRVLTE